MILLIEPDASRVCIGRPGKEHGTRQSRYKRYNGIRKKHIRHHSPLAQIKKEDELDLSFGKKWNHHSIKMLPSRSISRPRAGRVLLRSLAYQESASMMIKRTRKETVLDDLQIYQGGSAQGCTECLELRALARSGLPTSKAVTGTTEVVTIVK